MLITQHNEEREAFRVWVLIMQHNEERKAFRIRMLITQHNEEREAFRVQVLNDFDYLIERRKTAVLPAGTEHTIAAARIHMTYREAYARLSDIGETQLLRFYDTLDEKDRASLLEQISRTDFSYLNAFHEKDREIKRGHITPIPAMTLSEIKERRMDFRKTGFDAIRSGKLAAVLLAGGMGTRLGITGPKGAFNIGITKDVFIFQRLIENLLRVVEAANTWIHLFIMTSERNDAETRTFLREHQYFGYDKDHIHFFTQSMAPAVDENGHVLLETPSRIAVSPNGNGGWFLSMADAGYVNLLHTLGVTYLNVFAVDNVLQSIADPAFLGAVIETGSACGSKVVRKANPDEKVGVMCLEDGKPSVVEYIEMTDAMRTEKNADGSLAYGFGVILNYMFRVADLEKVMNEKMPVHFAHKKIPYVGEDGQTIRPDKENGWKFEYFILDMVHELPGCLPFEVEREREFAPVKNREGTDSVESARKLLEMNGIAL